MGDKSNEEYTKNSFKNTRELKFYGWIHNKNLYYQVIWRLVRGSFRIPKPIFSLWIVVGVTNPKRLELNGF